MTPKRKAALQWIYDRGDPSYTQVMFESGISHTILMRLFKADQIITYVSSGGERVVLELTDKGRRDLWEGTRK